MSSFHIINDSISWELVGKTFVTRPQVICKTHKYLGSTTYYIFLNLQIKPLYMKLQIRMTECGRDT